MRISDWSSDVCSSDLRRCAAASELSGAARGQAGGGGDARDTGEGGEGAHRRAGDAPRTADLSRQQGEQGPARRSRSEEHTSELQSLMRLSYAVFCLDKQKSRRPTHTNQTYNII